MEGLWSGALMHLPPPWPPPFGDHKWGRRRSSGMKHLRPFGTIIATDPPSPPFLSCEMGGCPQDRGVGQPLILARNLTAPAGNLRGMLGKSDSRRETPCHPNYQ